MLANLLPGLIGAGLAAILMIPVRRRRFIDPVGGRAQAKLFRRALREGRIPDRAERSRWRGYVEKELSPRMRGRLRLLWIAVLGVMVLLLVPPFLLLLASPSPSRPRQVDVAGLLGPVALLVVIFAALYLMQRNRLRRLDRLRRLLVEDERPG